MNSLLGDIFSHENNTHGSRLHDQDPQFASQILGAMTQSCYIGTRDIRSRVIRGPYCIRINTHSLQEPHSLIIISEAIHTACRNHTVSSLYQKQYTQPVGTTQSHQYTVSGSIHTACRNHSLIIISEAIHTACRNHTVSSIYQDQYTQPAETTVSSLYQKQYTQPAGT